ncbi:MAG: efflux RND transporter permease subunit [Novosphingobium sp.]
MNEFLQRHRASIALAVLLVTLGGLLAALRLPVALFPQIDYPRVVVSIDAGERAPSEMAAAITRPAEIALRAVPGVSRIRSTTSRGTAEISLFFPWGENMVTSELGVRTAMAGLIADLPPGTRFDVRRSDPTIFPVLGLALTSESLDPATLRQIAETKLRPALTTVPGVAGVDILGSSAREISVSIEPEQLNALGITLTDVANALAGENSVIGVGRVEDQHRLYLVLVDNQIATIDDLRRTPIKTGASAGAGVATLEQVAKIESSVEPVFTKVSSNGRDAVLVNIRQSYGGDTVAVVKAITSRVAAIGLPQSITVQPFYDQSELVVGAANAVRDAILIGAVLAGIVLFLFLRSARLMVLTGAVLPAVLAATCLALLALGMSFNMMTLGGMAAAVGLVIDDVVVMLEHIMRRMQEEKDVAASSLLASASEMGRPLGGSTLATVVVFLPLAFVSGVTGGFFKALAVTMVAALVVSLVYARYVVPLVAAHWLRLSDAEAAERGDLMVAHASKAYHRALDGSFARPGLVVTLTVLILGASGYLAYRHVPSGFMPRMDEGGFILDYKAKPGAALADTDALLRQAEEIITATPEVASYSRRTGLQLGGGLTEPDEGDLFIRLKSGSRRDIEAVMTDIRGQIETRVPGLTIETAQLMEDLIGDLTAVPQPIEVKLFGENRSELDATAKRVADAIGKIPGVVEVNDGQRVAGDAIGIKVDPGAAQQIGLDPGAIAAQLEGLITGAIATQIRSGEQLISVRVRAPEDLRRRVTEIGNLTVRSASGSAVPVREIATISIIAGQKQLSREDLSPFVAVTARLEGTDLGTAMREVQATVAGLKLPPSIRVDYGGLYAEQKKSFADLAMVFAAAVLLVALLLTYLFERPTFTLSALTTLALSAASVMTGLWLTGTELDISALMGLTMVVGMVTELIIFLLAELKPGEAVTPEALRLAGHHRLRPILMSALIAILTLAPLALGISRGAGLQKPLATAIIFGLTAAVPLVLIFMPAMLHLIDRRFQRQTAPLDKGKHR